VKSIHDLFDQLENNGTIHRRIVVDYEKAVSRTALAYFANHNHPASIIHDHDVDLVENMLRSLDLDPSQGKLDLILDSPGGLPYAAEKLVRVIRTYASEFRVVVPSHAMSAATLVALGSDVVVMSPTSRLGPIDPQMVYQTEKGAALRPAKAFVDAYGDLVHNAMAMIAQGKPADPFLHQLGRVDMPWVMECVRARQATQKIACELLKQSMMKGRQDTDVTNAVAEIMKLGEEIHHGRPFYREDAIRFGLVVDSVDGKSASWDLLWELYNRAVHFINGKGLAKYLMTRAGGREVRVNAKAA
jgi:anthranilate/para-aminobenzoate synthase component II